MPIHGLSSACAPPGSDELASALRVPSSTDAAGPHELAQAPPPTALVGAPDGADGRARSAARSGRAALAQRWMATRAAGRVRNLSRWPRPRSDPHNRQGLTWHG